SPNGFRTVRNRGTWPFSRSWLEDTYLNDRIRFSDEAATARFRPVCACALRGWRLIEFSNPPTSTLRPPPVTMLASALTPQELPAGAPSANADRKSGVQATR